MPEISVCITLKPSKGLRRWSQCSNVPIDEANGRRQHRSTAVRWALSLFLTKFDKSSAAHIMVAVASSRCPYPPPQLG